MDIPNIKDILNKPKVYNGRYIKIHYLGFFNYVNKHFTGDTFSEKMYKYFHPRAGKCKVCGRPTKYINFTKGFCKYCCQSCVFKENDTINKRKETCLKKYGVSNPSQIDSVKAKKKQIMEDKFGGIGFGSDTINKKIKQTTIQKYGVKNVSNSQEIQQKKENTCLEKYGSKSYLSTPNCREHTKQAMLKKYGVENGFSSPEIQSKIKQKFLEKYGVDNPMKSDIIKQQLQQKFLEKYGSISPYGNKEIQQKIKQKFLEKYGVDNPMKSDIIKQQVSNTKRETQMDKKDFLIGYDFTGKWICKCPHIDTCDKCNEKYYITDPVTYNNRKNYKVEQCTRIKPIGDNSSQLEETIKQWLDEYNISYETHNRDALQGLELDIYIPSKRIAIECNGVYWHRTSIYDSESKPKKYHYNKYLKCLDNRIQLITIWEDWLYNKPDIVKDVILSKLGIYKERIMARKCKIRELTTKQDKKSAKQLMDSSHIQGFTPSTLYYGLFYQDKLVAVMSFSKDRFVAKRGKWELVRFCSQPGMSIIGGAARLLHHFIQDQHPTSIISFSHNDISVGNLYKQLGFTRAEKINPSYWYVDKAMNRYHRATFMKQSIAKKGLVPEDLQNTNWTEFMVMDRIMYRIYDCGMMKWSLSIDPSKSI